MVAEHCDNGNATHFEPAEELGVRGYECGECGGDLRQELRVGFETVLVEVGCTSFSRTQGESAVQLRCLFDRGGYAHVYPIDSILLVHHSGRVGSVVGVWYCRFYECLINDRRWQFGGVLIVVSTRPG